MKFTKVLSTGGMYANLDSDDGIVWVYDPVGQFSGGWDKPGWD